MSASAILTKIGLPILIDVISETLQGSKHSVARGAGEALDELSDALLRGEISTEELNEMNRHTESLAQMKSEEYRTQISEINQSLRAEIASNDIYVRRMRPTFGYLMAITWAAQMLALAWVILEDPMNASLVMQGFESLGLIWTVGLSVLGIYVYKRSDDKKALYDFDPTGRMRFNEVHGSKMQHIESIPEPKMAQPPRGRV
nr:hypothetical protein 14 [Alphaproteobacteria bacterium]